MLDDNDFVSIVLETDRPNPNLAEAEVRFVPSQIPGGKFEIPDVYMSLDGCSLSIDDLGKSLPLQCSFKTNLMLGPIIYFHSLCSPTWKRRV